MYGPLREEIAKMKKIDTHEHYPAEKHFVDSHIDFFSLLSPYVCDNLLTAGMTVGQWGRVARPDTPFEEKWEIFEPFIQDIRHTTYFRAIYKTLKDCYGMQDITKQEALKVSEILKSENKPGLYRKINGRNNVEAVLSFLPWNMADAGEDEGMYPVPTVSDISIRSRASIDSLSEYTGVDIYSFDTLLNAVKTLMESYSKKGYKAVKFGSAYRRKLDFEAVSSCDAEKVFNTVLSEKVNGDTKMLSATGAVITVEEAKPLDDYITSYIAGLAGEMGMPVFFHAGIHAWNENNVEAIRVSYLENLVRRHPKTKFILLHCGMPFVDEAIMLCKYFANVHLNMTWCYIIDREQSMVCLKKFIELLPVSKISGFGGDYSMPQQVYGHLEYAMDSVAKVLEEYVGKNEMTREEAMEIARKWFYENPKKLLGI